MSSSLSPARGWDPQLFSRLYDAAERAPECRLRNSKWCPRSLKFPGLSAIQQKPHGPHAFLPVVLSQGKYSLHVTGTTKPHIAHQCNQNQLDPLPSPHASKPLPLPELWEPSRVPLSPHLSCFYLLLGMCVCSVVSKSLPRMDHNPPGSSVHGIFRARILKWVTISYSRGSSQPRDQT